LPHHRPLPVASARISSQWQLDCRQPLRDQSDDIARDARLLDPIYFDFDM